MRKGVRGEALETLYLCRGPEYLIYKVQKEIQIQALVIKINESKKFKHTIVPRARLASETPYTRMTI